MDKIPTAEEFLNNIGQGNFSEQDLIEFTKLHVEAAKKQFKIVFDEIDNPYPFERKDKLKDVYPLKNVI